MVKLVDTLDLKSKAK